MKIKYKCVIPFDPFNKNINLSNDKIKSILYSMIQKMHIAGWCHGDLHLCNIGFLENNLYILDHDTMYEIAPNKVLLEDWLKQWMSEGFDTEDLDEFINFDYINWQLEWLE